MACRITDTRRKAAFTLTEVMVASGLALVALLAILLLSFFASRSFASLANYMDMDQEGRFALDRMSREIRQARQVTAISPSSVALLDRDGNSLMFYFDPDSRTLNRVSGAVTNAYLSDCDFLQFTNFQGTVISNSFDTYDATYTGDTRLIQVSWACSRQIMGIKANNETIASAKIVLRNH